MIKRKKVLPKTFRQSLHLLRFDYRLFRIYGNSRLVSLKRGLLLFAGYKQKLGNKQRGLTPAKNFLAFYSFLCYNMFARLTNDEASYGSMKL